MRDDAFDNLTDKAPRRRWSGALTWGGLVTAGVVLYELTHQPALGTAAMCLKFGWEDFGTARWLRRHDPWRARGWACWWMFVAWGLWKSAAVAVGVNMTVIPGMAVLERLNGGRLPPDRLWAAVSGAEFTSIAGFALSAFATLVAITVALRNRAKLWLHASVGAARWKGLWPPYGRVRPSYNRLKILLPTAFFVFFVFMGAIAIQRVFELSGIAQEWGAGAWFCMLVGAGLLWSPVCQRVTANCPTESWLPDEVAAGMDDPAN